MNECLFDVSALERSRVRTLVLEIQREIDCLTSEGTCDAHRSALSALMSAWAGLVQVLCPLPSTSPSPSPSIEERV